MAQRVGGPPNNWVSSFGGPGWTLDEKTGQYYFHNHLAEQPDLNWWNEEVRDAFDGIFRFWSDRGVAGFRIDVCNVIIKDAELRDNPPATEEDDFETQMFGQRSVYNANRPEVHDVIRRWRRLADAYDEPRLLIGETPVPLDRLAEFYGDGHDELGLAFNFDFIGAPLDSPPPCGTSSSEPKQRCRPVRGRRGPDPTTTCSASPPAGRGTIPARSVWRSSCCSACVARRSSTRATRSAWPTSPWRTDDLRDPLGVRFLPYYDGRDAGRTPMQWSRRTRRRLHRRPSGPGSPSATWRRPTWPSSETIRIPS